MPDISLCKGLNCPIKETCLRFLLKPSEYQSYFMTPPYNFEENECIYYYAKKHNDVS